MGWLKVLLCLIALVQVLGLSFLFLGMVGGDLDSRSPQSADRMEEENGGGLLLPTLDDLPDRVALILIDALRVDMMTTRNFPFLLGSLRDKGKAGVLEFNVTVDSPTVTLPRVKTIVTGRAPTYLDVLKNFQTTDNSISSNQLLQENVIAMVARRRKDLNVCFFGDETWLRLFPTREDGSSPYFLRWEGVTSFFVKDFEEVDANVTRHLGKVEDCQLLILHYLGLDHIGHVHGPSERPDLILKKLREMDKAVQKVFNVGAKKKGSSSLVLVTGDHGMANAGGHGGSSIEEATTPLVAVIDGIATVRNQKPLHSSINQMDIAPTLAALFGIPPPNESQGKLILDILEFFLPYPHLETIYRQNCEHLLNQLGDTHEALTYRLWLSEVAKMQKPLSMKKYIELEEQLSSVLRGARSSDNAVGWQYTVGVSLLLMAECILTFLLTDKVSVVWSGGEYVLVSCLLPPLLVYFSSSFIEEEHYIRYFIFGALLIVFYVTSGPTDGFSAWCLVKVLACNRLLTAFNQTGDKWSHLPDLNDFFMGEKLTVVTACVGLALIWRFLVETHRNTTGSFAILVCTGFLKYAGGMDSWPFPWANELSLQQLHFFLIFLNSLLLTYKKSLKDAVFVTVLLVVLSLHRFQNFIVCGMILTTVIEIVGFFQYQQCLKAREQLKVNRTPLLSQVVIVWFAHSAFFFQGNSNGLATIDVSAGYIGLGSLSSSFLIGLLIFLNAYGNSMLVYLHFMTATFGGQRNKSSSNENGDVKPAFTTPSFSHPLPVISLLSNGLEGIVYSVTLIIFRHHLFVWSVFVPKLLYLISQSVMHFVLMFIYSRC